MSKKLQFLIWSPDYNDNSGGVMCLHLLAKELASFGEDVYISSKKTLKNSAVKSIHSHGNELQLDRIMAIYPEIINGNPYNCKYVTRWLLNTPGVIGGDGKYGESDLIYKYCEFFNAPDESKVSGFLRTLEPKFEIFFDKNQNRKGDCYLIKKGKNKSLDKHSDNDLNLDSWISDQYLSEVFNSRQRFISYDSITFHSVQAALCGCLSIIIPDNNISKEEYFKRSPLCKYGIAYGMDDIEHALKTQHLVKDHILSMKNECTLLVKSYISKCYELINKN